MTKELVNLYIKYDFFNTLFIQYDMYKFNYNQSININYRTPTIYLNGLFFNLPYTQIISIEKNNNTPFCNIKLKLIKNELTDKEYNDVLNLFNKMKKYNDSYFNKNKNKLMIKCKRTNKNKSLNNHYNDRLSHNLNNLSITNMVDGDNSNANNPDENNLDANNLDANNSDGNNSDGNNSNENNSYANNSNGNNSKINTININNSNKLNNQFDLKNKLFIGLGKNRDNFKKLIYTNYEYENFYYLDDEKNIIFNVEIKQIYLKKIFYQVVNNLNLCVQNNQDVISNKFKIKYFTEILDYLQNNILDSNFKVYYKDFIKDNIFLNLKFNVKTNNFYTKNNKILMKWKICDYSL